MTVHAYKPAVCPDCGVVIERSWDAERPSLNHQPGSKACRVRAWTRDAQQRDLARVSGEVAVALAELGVEILYGPVAINAKDDPFAARRGRTFTTSAFVARPALLVFDTLSGGGDRQLLPREAARLESALRVVRDNPEFAAAVSSVGALLEKTRERRSAILALIRELR